MSERSLNGRTILMSGGSRGIGLAIALRAAADGALLVRRLVRLGRVPADAVIEIVGSRETIHLDLGVRPHDLDVVVECSSGTYIRALARDLGAAWQVTVDEYGALWTGIETGLKG